MNLLRSVCDLKYGMIAIKFDMSPLRKNCFEASFIEIVMRSFAKLFFFVCTHKAKITKNYQDFVWIVFMINYY